jgi:actinorhodin biosynthesis protein ActVIA
MLGIETGDDGLINVSCYAVVSVTDREGRITWEPSCLVRDTLVWRGGRLFNTSRAIERDDHIAQRRGA